MKNSDPRCKKALSNAMLIYFALDNKFEIQFLKTKRSLYAPKVLRGISVKSGTIMDYESSIYEVSSIFCLTMQKLVEDCRGRNELVVTVTKDKFNSFLKYIDDSVAKYSNKIDGRTKEAAFTNFLAYKLLQLDYKLTTKTCSLKRPKEMHFFIWEAIKNETKELSLDDEDILIPLIRSIEELLKDKTTVKVDSLPNEIAEKDCSIKTESAFSPADSS